MMINPESRGERDAEIRDDDPYIDPEMLRESGYKTEESGYSSRVSGYSKKVSGYETREEIEARRGRGRVA